MYLDTLLTLATFVGYLIVTQSVSRILSRIGQLKEAAPKRAIYISKVFNIGFIILALLLLCFIWGVDYRGLLVFASSVLAVMGVAFVAQWSILSNITASIVIFFSYPSRIGDEIRIVDGDNSIEGTIVDINLFQVLIRNREGNIVNYPNNLIIQKPMIKLNKSRARHARKFRRPNLSGKDHA